MTKDIEKKIKSEKIKPEIASLIVESIALCENSNKLKVNLRCFDGIHSIYIDKDKCNKFLPGQIYYGHLSVHFSNDFIGDESQRSQIGTMSYVLLKLEDLNGNIVYKRKGKI